MSVLGRNAVATSLLVALLLLAVVPGQAQGQVHVVQRGETMWSIATRYGTTVQAIAQANGLANPRYVYVGQRLAIPIGGGSGRSTAATAQCKSATSVQVRALSQLVRRFAQPTRYTPVR